MAFDPNKFIAQIKNSGKAAEEKLQADADIGMQANLVVQDIASLSPSSIKTKMGGFADNISGPVTDRIAKAKDALPPSIDFREKLAEALENPSALGGVKALTESGGIRNLAGGGSFDPENLLKEANASVAGGPKIFGSDTLTSSLKSFGAKLGGSISKLTGGSIGAISGAKGLLPSGAPPSIPKGGIGGFDPGAHLPNIKVVTQPTYDEDGEINGEELVAIKFGKPSTAPIADEEEEDPADKNELIRPVTTIQSSPLRTSLSAIISKGLPRIKPALGRVQTQNVWQPRLGCFYTYKAVETEDGGKDWTTLSYPDPDAEAELFQQQQYEEAVKLRGTPGHPYPPPEETSTINALNSFRDKLLGSAGVPARPDQAPTGLAAQLKGSAAKFAKDTQPMLERENKYAEEVLQPQADQADQAMQKFFKDINKPMGPGVEEPTLVDPEV